jgi:hypothetical protein
MKLYIYNIESNEIVVIVNGETNEQCEEKAIQLDRKYPLDEYGWSYTTGNELYETTQTEEI